jgi:hypothetical protein
LPEEAEHRSKEDDSTKSLLSVFEPATEIALGLGPRRTASFTQKDPAVLFESRALGVSEAGGAPEKKPDQRLNRDSRKLKSKFFL